MTIRPASDSDIEPIAHIHNLCFPDPTITIAERSERLRSNPRYGINDILVVVVDGRCVGSLILIPHATLFSGVRMKCGGIGGVAVLPEFQNRGISTALMAEAFEQMSATRAHLSLLYPFRLSFYERLGYGQIGEVNLLTFPPSALPLYAERAAVHPFQEKDIPALMRCYTNFARRRTCVLLRNERVWRDEIVKNMQRGQRISCHHDRKTVDGYIIVTGAEEVEVKEFVYTSDVALRGLLGFLAASGKNVTTIRMREYAGESIHFAVKDIAQAQKVPSLGLFLPAGTTGLGPMLRLVDVSAALKLRRFQPVRGSVTFTIADPRVERNNITTTLAFEGTSARVARGTSRNRIGLSVSTLSRLYSGYLRFSVAQKLGLLTANFDTSFLDDAFALPPPACLDFF